MGINVRYLGRSGFEITHSVVGQLAEQNVQPTELLVVDCYQKQPLADLSRFDRVLVLASHGHSDHFSLDIFDWQSENLRIHYVLSSDIAQTYGAKIPPTAPVSYLSPGEVLQRGALEIRAFGSTDLGCSFALLWPEETIFHAGDFNLWDWREESTLQEIQEATVDFETILAEIVAGMPRPDVAFFPVDPRQVTDYYRGALRFAQELLPRVLVPMHFGKSFKLPASLFEEIAPWSIINLLQQRGDSFDL